MSITTEFYGTTTEGCDITLYKLKNKNGVEAQFINYGAVLLRLLAPDNKGNIEDIVLGYETIQDYENNDTGFGSLIGRHANRIGGARCTIDGVTYELEKNDGDNNLHGGTPAYNKVVYEVTQKEGEGQDTLVMYRESPHMEQGFPGNLKLWITYTLNDENQLSMDYVAKTDQTTIINLTNHSYFNLAGHKSGSVLGQKVWIDADAFTLTDEGLIPTGEIQSVEGTPMDFRIEKSLGQDIEADYEPLKVAGGYDHNYILNVTDHTIKTVASLYDEQSGRYLEVATNKPGMQMYTGNFLTETSELKNKEQAIYHKQDAVCFETQFYPNSCNIESFPTSIFKAGEDYHYTTVYTISLK